MSSEDSAVSTTRDALILDEDASVEKATIIRMRIIEAESKAKIEFQTTFIKFVVWSAGLVLAWLVFIYTCANLNVVVAGKVFVLSKEETRIIITAISANSLGLTFTVAKGLFSVKDDDEKGKKPLVVLNESINSNLK
jgi:hypothetical protein